MSIVKCKSCGKQIHIGVTYGNACVYCGTTNEMLTNTEDTQALTFCSQGENYLRNHNFSNALKVYDNAIERFPHIAELYWGRLLAEHSCSNDLELIKKGINLAEEPDYSVAIHFASADEKECYLSIKEARESISKDMLTVMASLEVKEKFSTNIVSKQQDTEKEILELKKLLESQIFELDVIEHTIRNLAVDCNSLLDSEKTHINHFVKQIEKMKSELQSKNEITYENHELYVSQLKKYQNLCNEEWNIIQSKSNIPSYSEIKKMQKEQAKVETLINQTVSRIDQIYKNLQKLTTSISQIHNKFKLAKSDMNKGSFGRAIGLIGNVEFMNLVRKYVGNAQ